MPGQIDLDEVASAEHDHRGRYPWRVMVCNSTACLASGARGVRTTLERTAEEQHLTHDVQIVPTGCMGLCSRGPLVRVDTRGGESTLYGDMTDQTGAALVRSRRYGHERAGGVARSSFYHHYARLIEVLACVELIERALDDPVLLDSHVRAHAGINAHHAEGASEAREAHCSTTTPSTTTG